MKPYLVKMPKLIQWIFPRRVWAFSRKEKNIYLTFDDGPIPEITPWVLEQLEIYDAKATFFCIGENIKKHPEIFKKVVKAGHTIGNHTQHHLNGKRTKTLDYLNDVELFEETITNSNLQIQNAELLFRPPFGKLKPSQARAILKKGYKIIMYDVLSADFDATILEEKCLENVLQNIKPGSVIVFHDSLKAEKNLRYALPKILKFISKKGWNFTLITSGSMLN